MTADAVCCLRKRSERRYVAIDDAVFRLDDEVLTTDQGFPPLGHQCSGRGPRTFLAHYVPHRLIAATLRSAQESPVPDFGVCEAPFVVVATGVADQARA
jgi:hypothetical protein